MGELALVPTSKNELQPNFHMILDLTDRGSVDAKVGTKVILQGVRFENWHLISPEDDFVMEKLTFKAVRIGREEKTGS